MTKTHKAIDFQVNTLTGAHHLLQTMLKNNPTRINHTIGVVRETENILNRLKTTEPFRAVVLQAAYLHDIGYADDLNKHQFHAYDGYLYLKEEGWSSLIYKPVLHHSFSETLVHMWRQDLRTDYQGITLTREEEKIVEIITLADMNTLPSGERTTFKGRLADVLTRYGEGSVHYKHMLAVEPHIGNLANKLNYIN